MVQLTTTLLATASLATSAFGTRYFEGSSNTVTSREIRDALRDPDASVTSDSIVSRFNIRKLFAVKSNLSWTNPNLQVSMSPRSL